MVKKDPEGLKRLLGHMGFTVVEERENIIASGIDYNSSRNNIWVNNVEKMLIPSVYGYVANFKRWKIVFVPCYPTLIEISKISRIQNSDIFRLTSEYFL